MDSWIDPMDVWILQNCKEETVRATLIIAWIPVLSEQYKITVHKLKLVGGSQFSEFVYIMFFDAGSRCWFVLMGHRKWVQIKSKVKQVAERDFFYAESFYPIGTSSLFLLRRDLVRLEAEHKGGPRYIWVEGKFWLANIDEMIFWCSNHLRYPRHNQ